MRTTIPFMLAGKRGAITVRYTVNQGWKASGFDVVVPGMAPFDVRGFPVLRAAVAYRGRGYAGILGWVQVVTHTLDPGKRPETLVDVIPSTIGQGVPFAALGYLPTFFDAPSTHPRPNGAFVARAFLCRPPLLDRKEPARFLAGFSWGYSVAGPGAAPRIAPLKVLRPADWRPYLPLLRRKYPAWRFADR